ncbi:hypothetical protein [Pedosphaera parvula]|uniref:hypothetical protein n=1 Tax=Pedosphaera parvula TaxID=1032527 RepID=UPI00030BD150|nr:hypothetical protein [Pedosphaera parvula]
MKTSLLLACLALGIIGCSTCDDRGGRGGVGEGAETTVGRNYGWENSVETRDPRGPWENWRYGGDPDRIAPRVPVDPAFPPAPVDH